MSLTPDAHRPDSGSRAGDEDRFPSRADTPDSLQANDWEESYEGGWRCDALRVPTSASPSRSAGPTEEDAALPPVSGHFAPSLAAHRTAPSPAWSGADIGEGGSARTGNTADPLTQPEGALWRAMAAETRARVQLVQQREQLTAALDSARYYHGRAETVSEEARTLRDTESRLTQLLRDTAEGHLNRIASLREDLQEAHRNQELLRQQIGALREERRLLGHPDAQEDICRRELGTAQATITDLQRRLQRRRPHGQLVDSAFASSVAGAVRALRACALPPATVHPEAAYWMLPHLPVRPALQDPIDDSLIFALLLGYLAAKGLSQSHFMDLEHILNSNTPPHFRELGEAEELEQPKPGRVPPARPTSPTAARASAHSWMAEFQIYMMPAVPLVGRRQLWGR